MCLPGGKRDPEDKGDDVKTALREAHEEVRGGAGGGAEARDRVLREAHEMVKRGGPGEGQGAEGGRRGGEGGGPGGTGC